MRHDVIGLCRRDDASFCLAEAVAGLLDTWGPVATPGVVPQVALAGPPPPLGAVEGMPAVLLTFPMGRARCRSSASQDRTRARESRWTH